MDNFCNPHNNKQNKQLLFLSYRICIYEVLELVSLMNASTSFLMSHKTTIHWILHTWFSDLLHWTIVIHVIHAMPKIVFFFVKRCTYEVL